MAALIVGATCRYSISHGEGLAGLRVAGWNALKLPEADSGESSILKVRNIIVFAHIPRRRLRGMCLLRNSKHYVKADFLELGYRFQFFQRLDLDLPDSFSGDPEFLANTVQGQGVTVFQSEPHLNDLMLARGKL